MSLPGFSPPLSAGFLRLRLPAVLGSLGAILYFTLAVALVPDAGLDWAMRPDGTLEVVSPQPGAPAERLLRAGDTIIAIDGIPTTHTVDWRPLFAFGAEAYTYTVRAAQGEADVSVPVVAIDLDHLRYRMVLHVTAIMTWLAGALVLLFATPSNRAAWHTGYVILGVGLSMAAASAAAYYVPFGQSASAVLLPVAGVAFAGLALQPREGAPGRAERAIFTAAYAIAVALAALHLFDLYALRPVGLRLHTWLGAAPSRLGVLYGLAWLQTSPLIIIGRYLRTPHSPAKQQLRVLVVSLIVSITPVMVLSIIPGAVTGDFQPLGPAVFEIALLFLLLLPAAYGYLIYRHKYLGLDIFATHTLTWLALGLLVVVGYALFMAAVRDSPALSRLEPLPSSAFVFAAVSAAPATGRASLAAARGLLFGQRDSYDGALAGLPGKLASRTEISLLGQAAGEIAALLQVRQSALFVANLSGGCEVVDARRVEVAELPAAGALGALPPGALTRSSLDPGALARQPLLRDHAWAEAAIPLRVSDQNIGVWLLGPRVPDGGFDAYQVAFLRKAGAALAVAAHAVQLFEASRAVSRERLQAEDAERARLAALIHDDPLQRLSFEAQKLGRIAGQVQGQDRALAEEITECQAALRGVGAQLRDICVGLRPPVLNEGLAWAVLDAAYKFQAQTDMPVQTAVDVPACFAAPDAVTAALYHIVTEALNNVRKHAGARNVWVELSVSGRDGCVQLSVTDDGCGLAAGPHALADLVRAHQFGLVGLHEWARLAGGELRLAPRPGGGTVVSFTSRNGAGA